MNAILGASHALRKNDRVFGKLANRVRSGKSIAGFVMALVLAILAGGGAYFLLSGFGTNPNEKTANSAKTDAGVKDQIDSKDKRSRSQLAIPNEELEYLQKVEHLGGFVLGDLAFPKIKKALVDADLKRLTSFFSEDFSAQVFNEDAGTKNDFPFASFVTWTESDQTATLDRDEFAQFLIGLRKSYKSLDRVGIKVMKMSPTDPKNTDLDWTGSLKIIMGGQTTDDKISHRVIKFNCKVSSISDETPNLTGWLTSCKSYAQKYALADDFLLSDMTKRTGIDVAMLQDNWKLNRPGQPIDFLTGGIYFCDYNNDGNADILLTDMNGLLFYQGKGGGKFKEVSSSIGLPPVRELGAVFADFDNDGFQDLILNTQIYRNFEGKQFIQLNASEHDLELPSTASNFSVCDYDKDGLIDIYLVGIGIKGKDKRQKWIGKNDAYYNLLLKNKGNWKFEDVTEKSGTTSSGTSTFSAVWFDANGDNWPDVMTACEFGQNDYFINQHDGTFKRGELPGIYGGFSMGITVNDIDNDGFGDVYVANMYSKAGERVVGNLRKGIYDDDVDAKMRDFVSGNELYHNKGNGTFERIGVKTGINDIGWSYGVGYADLNSDGFPDIYSPVGFQSVSRKKPDG